MFQSPNLNRREASDRMYIQQNPGTFTSSGRDDMRARMHGESNPARSANAQLQDSAFSSEPIEDTLVAHITGTQSPTRPTGTSGSIRSGNTP